MIRKSAEFISILFHPLVQTMLLVIIIYEYVPELMKPFDSETVPSLLFMLATLTFLVPLMSIIALRVIGAIDSIRMETRQERLMPFFFIGCYYALTVYLFSQKIVLSDIMIRILQAVTILIFLIFIITFFMKISVHAAASWGIFGLLLAIHLHLPDAPLLIPLLGLLLLAGLVCSIRLLLNVHSPKEVYAGAILGFVLCFGFLYFTM